MIKPGATVIDVGITRVNEDGKSKLVGDVDFDGKSWFYPFFIFFISPSSIQIDIHLQR